MKGCFFTVRWPAAKRLLRYDFFICAVNDLTQMKHAILAANHAEFILQMPRMVRSERPNHHLPVWTIERGPLIFVIPAINPNH